MTYTRYKRVRMSPNKWNQRHEEILKHLDAAWKVATKAHRMIVNGCQGSNEAIRAIGDKLYPKDIAFLAEHGYTYTKIDKRIHKDGKTLMLDM